MRRQCASSRGTIDGASPASISNPSDQSLLLLSARLDRINIGGTAPASHVHSTDNDPRGDFGLIGLAVMGQNLILNAADHGYKVIAFNRTVSKVDHFLANEAKGKLPNSPMEAGIMLKEL